MKRNMMRKNLFQSIRTSLGRYIAIVAIIALGAAIFVGLRVTKTDMVATGQKFTDEQNMFDLRLVSSYGWNRDQVEAVAALDGVVDAEGGFYLDVMVQVGRDEDDVVYRVHSIPETINTVVLEGGRMPESPNECLIDGFRADDSILGTTITVSAANDEDTLDTLQCETFTVVGYVASPLYMDMNRGTTSVGSGSISSYLYVPDGAFDANYYTEIYVTIPGDWDIYSDEYNAALDAAAEAIEPLLTPLAAERAEQVIQEAEDAYAEGMEEYLDGLAQFEEGKLEAEQELADAEAQLLDGEQQIADNELILTASGEQIESAWDTIAQSELSLLEARRTYLQGKADGLAQLAEARATLFENYKTVNENLLLVNSGLTQIDAGLIELEAGITQLEAGLTQIDSGLTQLDLLLSILEPSIQVAQSALDSAAALPGSDDETLAKLQAKLDELIAQRDEYQAQRAEAEAMQAEYSAMLDDLYVQKEEVEAQRTELESNKAMLEAAMATIETGFEELESSQLSMEQQLASAEAQLESGELQLEMARRELEIAEDQLQDGWAQLEEAKAELQDGWAEYEEGKAEAERELAEAQAELDDAAAQLADARETIDKMGEAQVYVLDRSTNVGYSSLDSNSDIVSGVSRVFPVFFLLVAALVCITTMTRMVDDERTQIGVLKALGYSSRAIINKYLFYAGSGAVVGCGLGVILGSVVFPMILWEAYGILMHISDRVELTFDWPLCLAVVAAYTAVMLLVTWTCCRRSLREEPAELMRPKPPAAGKNIFLERLPFWRYVSFLNKVAIRNIIRYRQRLAMMLVGIGGCTALLLTGFGLRDSITNLASYQFEEITVYDIQVYFDEGQSDEQQAAFRRKTDGYVEDVIFYHQQSVKLECNDQSREIYLMAADASLADFIDLHDGEDAVYMPGKGGAVLSVGIAEAMGVSVGDTVVLRDSDQRPLTVTVTGIYDNNVYNYAIVLPETVEEQWGETPSLQMALIHVDAEQDVHQAGADLTGLSGVMSVTINQDVESMVGSMMDALDLVVVTIVICAGALAVIVLYNLTNINITERIREIATIKVLGFNSGESAAYVFKENLALTAMGALLGLLGGKFLLSFVISQIKVDMVWIQPRIGFVSCLVSLILTMLAACFVAFIFYRKLEKINMAEALKSVE